MVIRTWEFLEQITLLLKDQDQAARKMQYYTELAQNLAV